jgi:ParB family chromosome partitioning protein
VPKPKPGMGRGLEAILSKPKPAMGRGLEAILSASGEEPAAQEIGELRELRVDQIDPGPRQPRRRFEEDALRGLAESLRERGVLQPVLVRPAGAARFELVAGERRWRAAQMAGMETIPALVRERADAEALELALIENMARADLSPIEEAQACAALTEELGLTREEVGRRVGRSRVAVSNLMRLLELPDEAIELLQDGVLSEGHGRALLVAEDHAARRTLATRAAQEGWSVRTAESRARESNARAQSNGAGARRRRISAPHPDQQQAAAEIAQALGEALGVDVQVRPTRAGGYRAELSFASPAEAIELARRVRSSALA